MRRTVTNNLRFPGQYYDEETGLHYNYFRDYKPMIGRYVEADPIGIERGKNHLYLYVANNPLNISDVKGLAGCGPGSGILDWLVPDYPFGDNFKGCCDEHDNCYGCKGKSEGKKKEDCDDKFCKCLFKKCLSFPSSPFCFQNSFIYCTAVVRLGGGAFKKGRECCN